MEFFYKARTKEGKLQSGSVESSTRQAALEVLRRHQLTVVNLEEKKSEGFFGGDFRLKHVASRDIVAFSRSFASLFDAGVPLVEGLRVVADQTDNGYFRSVILEVVDDVDGGMKLSQALGKHPRVFSEFYQNMVKAGETSGALQETLFYLADYTERQYQLKSAIQSALLYPLFIILVFVIVFFIMMVFVVPQLTTLLAQIGKGELPLLTRLLISLSNFTSQWFFAILFLLAAGIVWGGYWVRTPQGRRTWHELQLKLPIFGPLFKTIYQARFADNLATLIKGGIPIVEAMHVVAGVVGNSLYQELILKIAEEVKAGNTIESMLRRHELFSPLLVQMVAVGERSGKLEEILSRVALFFEAEVDRTIKGLTPLIEPLLIIILGVGVGLMVGAILIPIYTVIGSGAGAL
ncbi:MAG: type II secretion system F family protein [Candidatus Portnoybacteria bacterium]|nr:type II secretion system F family protein [Candidatus Portnoybacteria bacterium]